MPHNIEAMTLELEASYSRYKDDQTPENLAALSNSMLYVISFYAHEGLEDDFGKNLMLFIKLNGYSLNDEQTNILAENFYILTRQIEERIFHQPDILDSLFTLMMELQMDPQSKNYVRLYQCVHRFRKIWKGYIHFCRWWNLDNFKAEDYTIKKNSKMSLAESALIFYTKCLINTDFEEDLAKLAVTFIKRLSEYPLTKYSNYYTAKLLYRLKFDNETVRQILRSFVIQKTYKPWTWHLMSKTFDCHNEFMDKYSCLLLALKYGKIFPDAIINNIYLDLAMMFYNTSQMPYAKFFFEIYMQIRRKLNLKIPDYVDKIIGQRSYMEIEASRPNTSFDFTEQCRNILRRTKEPDQPFFDDLIRILETNYSETLHWSQEWYDTLDDGSMSC